MCAIAGRRPRTLQESEDVTVVTAQQQLGGAVFSRTRAWVKRNEEKQRQNTEIDESPTSRKENANDIEGETIKNKMLW